MAYKFQLGEAQLSGALVQEGAIAVHNESGDTVANFSQAGVISGSGQIQGASIQLRQDGVIGTAEDTDLLTLEFEQLTVAGKVSGSGQLAGGTLSVGDDGVVSVSSTGVLGLANGGYIDANADAVLNSVSVGMNLSSSADLDLAGASNITAPGLSLSVTDMKKLDAITDGQGAANKAVVLDASRNISNINELTASYFKGDGSGITNINVENLDAVGSDTYVQFNNNGEFSGSAGFTFNGTGSVTASVAMQAADLFATNLTSERLVMGGSGGKLVDDAKYFTATNFFGFGTNAIIASSSAAAGLAAIADGALIMKNDGEDLFVVAGGTATFGSEANGVLSINCDYDSADEGAISGSNSAEFKELFINNSDGAVISADLDAKVATLQVTDMNVDGGIAYASNTDGNMTNAGNLTWVNASNRLNINGELTSSGQVVFEDDLTLVTAGKTMQAPIVKMTDLDVPNQFLLAGSGGLLTSSANVIWGGAVTGLQVDCPLTNSSGARFEGLVEMQASLQATGLGSIALGDIDLSADLMIANDSATGVIKNMSLANYASKLAGAGLSATAGVLSTQAQAVSTDFNAGVAIAEGYNIYTGSANISVALPTGSGLTAGDVFVVKQNAAGEVTLNPAGTDTIDGESSVLLESPYAAVSLVYSGVDGQFRIV
jgi:hypothetical protein